MDKCRCGQACRHDLCVGKVPIFSALNQEEMLKISELIHHRTYRKGDSIISEGDRPDSLFILNEGSVKVFRYTSDGREQILYVFSEGDFFGEQYLLGSKPASGYISALETVNVCMLSRSDFRSLLNIYPDIAVRVIESLDDRLSHLENAIQSIGVRNIDGRIASLLLYYAEKFGTYETAGVKVRLPLNREGMANYLGIARETVSRKLGQMENDGLLRTLNNKTFLLLDRHGLEELAGAPE